MNILDIFINIFVSNFRIVTCWIWAPVVFHGGWLTDQDASPTTTTPCRIGQMSTDPIGLQAVSSITKSWRFCTRASSVHSRLVIYVSCNTTNKRIMRLFVSIIICILITNCFYRRSWRSLAVYFWLGFLQRRTTAVSYWFRLLLHEYIC